MQTPPPLEDTQCHLFEKVIYYYDFQISNDYILYSIVIQLTQGFTRRQEQ